MTDVLDKPATSPISTRRHGDVLIVLSNNPPVNALSTAVRQGLVDAIAEAEADDAVRAVVIACEGQTFFAGADITEFGKPPQQPWLPIVVDTIENCSKPVVAAVHGTALGGGLEVALGCHYRVADPSAKLGTPEVKLGIMCGYAGTQRLPRLVGKGRALEMLLTGEMVDAAEALRIGLVNRVVPREKLLGEAEGLLRKMLANGPVSLRFTLEAVNDGLEMGFDEAERQEATLFGLICTTEDMKEGTKAFLEKRPPNFTGR